LKPGLGARLEALLRRHWWRPGCSLLCLALAPLSLLYRALRAAHLATRPAPEALPVPVLVVGNLVVGGAGKTPAVMALVQALQRAGWHPGVISRGHGRRSGEPREVDPGGNVAELGDEPLIIRRRCGVPVWVGRRRVQAARALCAAHPAVDVLVSDDGLQHAALPRAAELLVFDERGAGNGRLLPAGPLREPLPQVLGPRQRVLYTAGIASTGLPGQLAMRSLMSALPLKAWHDGDASQAVALSALRGVPLLAVAGLAAPQKFFAMLRDQGLQFSELAMPDHEPYTTLPWRAGTADVITTEKDAIKFDPQRVAPTRIWVVPLDLAVPQALVDELIGWLSASGPPLPSPQPSPRPLPPSEMPP
jgi:tetraacyldisaccharide 4'-kinase